MLLFPPVSQLGFFSYSKTIYNNIFNSIYILINTLSDNTVIYIYPQTALMKCLPHSVPYKNSKMTLRLIF